MTTRREANEPPTTTVIDTHRHGERSPESVPWLIRNRVPAIGTEILSGQSRTFKTFVLLDMMLSIMNGGTWTGEPVYRQGGVLLFAVEGGTGIALRLAAAIKYTLPTRVASRMDLPDSLAANVKAVDPARLPFEWATTCPPLSGGDPLPALIATARRAHDRFMKEFDLPLVMVAFDTMAVAARMEDENSSAEGAKLWADMRRLSDATGAVVVGVDHVGKDDEKGTRGTSAKEDNVDAVLMLLGKKSPEGRVTDTRMVLRKMKEGPGEEEIPFEAGIVQMGQTSTGSTSPRGSSTGRPPGSRRRGSPAAGASRNASNCSAGHWARPSCDGAWSSRPTGKKAWRPPPSTWSKTSSSACMTPRIPSPATGDGTTRTGRRPGTRRRSGSTNGRRTSRPTRPGTCGPRRRRRSGDHQ